MEVLVNNVAHDDDSVTANGTDWLLFNGAVASTLYFNGNSFVGLGSNTEHIKVCRRDCKMWYLYREEGTINNYKFLKFRWEGYAQYNSTSENDALKWELIFVDTGDIFLHVIRSSTNLGYAGTNNIVASKTISFNVSLGDVTTDVWFKSKTETNNDFDVVYEIPPLGMPIRLLFQDGETLYKLLESGEIEPLTETVPTAELFDTYGVHMDKTKNYAAVLHNLANPKILAWRDEEFSLNATALATPFPQTIVTDFIDISDETILGVETVIVTQTGSPLYAISFDSKVTWEAWNGTGWYVLDTDVSGMTNTALASIGVDQWAEKLRGLTGFHMKLILHDADTVESIVVDFIN